MGYVKTPKKTRTVCDICDTLGDDLTIRLFLDGIEKKGLSRKQYYSRVSHLMETGLVNRFKGKYELTSTGIVVRRALELMIFAVKENEMLRVYDVYKRESGIPDYKLLDRLIDNQEIKNMLLKDTTVGDSLAYNHN